MMRAIAVASVASALAIGVLVAGQPATEPFPYFVNRFAQDASFRMSRITFPLRAVLGNPTDPRTKEQWSLSQLDSKFTAPIASRRLEAEGLKQAVTFPSKSEAEVEQSQPQSDSYILIYRFKLKKGLWYLVEFEDSSY